MSQTITVTIEAADLHGVIEGEGPLLLLIAGAGGDGARYAPLAAELARDFRVLRYDRRCCGLSTGDRNQPMTLAQQARDAAAMIVAAGGGPALVVGNSGGANIALTLAETRPDLVAQVLAHEPPALPVLPDAAEWLAFSDQVEAAYAAQGLMPAMMLFLSAIKGVSGPPPGGRPDPRNLSFFLEQELHAICRYARDIAALARLGDRLVLASGADSADAYYARTAPILAQATGARLAPFAGHHFAFAADPARYAADIRAALGKGA